MFSSDSLTPKTHP